jgi:hypothetical protein
METNNLKKTLEDLAEEYKKKLEAQAKIDKTYASGRFSKSFESSVSNDGFEIYSTAPYAGSINQGSNPATSKSGGFDKKRRIEQWIKSKNIRPYRKLKNGYKFSKVTASSMKSMVYAISKAIADRGTIKRYNYEGSKIFQKVYESMQKKVGVEVGSAFSADLREELITIVNKFNK